MILVQVLSHGDLKTVTRDGQSDTKGTYMHVTIHNPLANSELIIMWKVREKSDNHNNEVVGGVST